MTKTHLFTELAKQFYGVCIQKGTDTLIMSSLNEEHIKTLRDVADGLGFSSHFRCVARLPMTEYILTLSLEGKNFR